MGKLFQFTGAKMFSLQHKILRSDSFQTPIRKLANCSDYKNIQNLQRVASFVKAVENALLTSQKKWVEIGEKYIKIDESTKTFQFSNAGPVFKDDVDHEEAKKAVAAFLEDEVIVKSAKLSINDIACVKLCPADIVALDSVLA